MKYFARCRVVQSSQNCRLFVWAKGMNYVSSIFDVDFPATSLACLLLILVLARTLIVIFVIFFHLPVPFILLFELFSKLENSSPFSLCYNNQQWSNEEEDWCRCWPRESAWIYPRCLLVCRFCFQPYPNDLLKLNSKFSVCVSLSLFCF